MLLIHSWLYYICFVYSTAFMGLCVCALISSLFLYIASIHSWENLMCYWMIFIQIYCIENINSADYDWLMIMFDCEYLFVYLYEWMSIEPVHIYDCERKRARVHSFIFHFSRACTVYTIHITHTYIYLPQLVILISDVEKSRFSRVIFSLSLNHHPGLNAKSKAIE